MKNSGTDPNEKGCEPEIVVDQNCNKYCKNVKGKVKRCHARRGCSISVNSLNHSAAIPKRKGIAWG